MENNIVTYEPDNSLKKGYASLFRDIVNEFIINRWLFWQLFKRDFLAVYKQSFIGVFWALIIPLISVGTFVLLNRSGIFVTGSINVPYPVYAVLGMASWQLFATGLISGSNSLVKAGSMVVKINFSKKSLVLASSIQGVVSFAVQLLLGVILCFAYGIIPKWQILFVPMALLPLLLLTFGISMLLAVLNGIMRDVGNVITVLLTFLMFLTPVLYVIPDSGLLAELMRLNPLSYFISASRQLILYGAIYEWRGFICSSLISVFIFVVCLLAFHLTETRVAERI
jgi:lipopolysaccharide transport system permease protein